MKTKYCIIIVVLLIIIGTFMFYSSHRPVYHKSEDHITMNNTRPIEQLKKLVLSKGDTVAYNELSTAYYNVDYYEQEYLLYSIIMANKYNYPRAYFNVYLSLTSIFQKHIYAGKIDKNTLDLALKYLKKGVELNDKQSTHELSKLYLKGKYVPKDTLLGKKLAEKVKLYW